MWIALGIIATSIIVAIFACLWVAGKESREEEDEHEY
jgi:hypothetical protein